VKKAFTEYHDQLEKLRSTLLATKQTSAFAEEVQLREQITEVYAAVANQEAKPSNLQLQRISLLQADLKKAKQQWSDINKKYENSVVKALPNEVSPATGKTF
jgi:hypothetical protein